MMSFWEVISPTRYLNMARGGIFDLIGLAALLVALALLVVLIVRFIQSHKRDRKKGAARWFLPLVLAVVMVFLLMVAGYIEHPGLILDLTQHAVVTPSEDLKDGLVPDGSSVVTQLSARQDERDVNAEVLLTKLSGVPGFRNDFINNQTLVPNSLSVTVNENTGYISPNDFYVRNPLAEDESARVFNLETELLQAVSNLQRSSTLFIYRLAGEQDESRPDVLFDAMLKLRNMQINPLDLRGAVPLDARFVLIDNPTEDLTEQQALNLSSYMARGGKLLLITDYANGAMPYLSAIMRSFGMQAIDGAVLDPMNQLNGHAEYPLPELTDHVISRTISSAGRSVSMPLSHAIEGVAQENVTVTSLLNTSPLGYVKLNAREDHDLEQADGDPMGILSLAMCAETNASRLVWIASSDMMTKDASDDLGGANQAFITACMNWLTGELVEPLPAKPAQ